MIDNLSIKEIENRLAQLEFYRTRLEIINALKSNGVEINDGNISTVAREALNRLTANPKLIECPTLMAAIVKKIF